MGESRAVAHKPDQTEEVDVQSILCFSEMDAGSLLPERKVHEVPRKEHVRSGLGHRTVLVSQLGARLRDIQHAAFLMLLYPSGRPVVCQRCHERQLYKVSPRSL